MIKTPLRYPGGKSRAIKTMIKYLPEEFKEYREPFVGGGSLFIYLKQKKPNLKIWINDLNQELYLFWKIAQENLPKLVEEIEYFKNKYGNGKQLFLEMTNIDPEKLSNLERAIRFFILNRITFSGTVESGGFSQQAFDKRFTNSSIERLEKLESILTNVKITNLDYSLLLEKQPQDIVIYLDPPYLKATKSKLYGKKGKLHTSFNHDLFAKQVTQCPNKWLITYDNCSEVIANFHDYHIYQWELQYGMNNYKQNSAQKGRELFICNYEVDLTLYKTNPDL